MQYYSSQKIYGIILRNVFKEIESIEPSQNSDFGKVLVNSELGNFGSQNMYQECDVERGRGGGMMVDGIFSEVRFKILLSLSFV